MLAVTIKIQYLCVFKVHKIKNSKTKTKKKQITTLVVHREVQIHRINLFYSKRVQIKMQQNRDINALLKVR